MNWSQIRNRSLQNLRRSEPDAERGASTNPQRTVAHLSTITDQLHDEVVKARMQPIDYVFNKFPRLVRQISQELGKPGGFLSSPAGYRGRSVGHRADQRSHCSIWCAMPSIMASKQWRCANATANRQRTPGVDARSEEGTLSSPFLMMAAALTPRR